VRISKSRRGLSIAITSTKVRLMAMEGRSYETALAVKPSQLGGNGVPDMVGGLMVTLSDGGEKQSTLSLWVPLVRHLNDDGGG
jgi:hypothetical protein